MNDFYMGQKKGYVPSTDHMHERARVAYADTVRVEAGNDVEIEIGELVYLEGFLGFALQAVDTTGDETSDELEIQIGMGVYETDQIDTGQDFEKGTKIYWEDGESRLSETPTDVFAGVVLEAKDENDVIWFVMTPGILGDTAMNAIGTMGDLETEATDELVNAINEVARAKRVPVRNDTAGTLEEGELVYISGWSAAEGRFRLTEADADAGGRLAQWILREDIEQNENGVAWKRHTLEEANTEGGSVGDPIYLHTTAGEWTRVAPTAADSVQQIVGRITEVGAEGEIAFDLTDTQIVKFGTNELQEDAVTNDEIAEDAVGTDEIQEDAVTNDEVAEDAVGTDEIQDDALAADADGRGKMANDFFDEGAVNDKFEGHSIGEAKLADPAADGLNALRVARATWDYAEHGGAETTHDLGVTIPDNSIIVGGLIEVVTAVTGDATIEVGVVATDDILGTTGTNQGTALLDVLPDMTQSAAVPVATADNITLTVAADTADSGKVVIFLYYLVSE